MRRHLLTVGVTDYMPGWGPISEGVRDELARMEGLFLDELEYDKESFGRLDDLSSGDELKLKVDEWFDSIEWSPEDLAVVYYSGHGYVDSVNSLRLITPNIAFNRGKNALGADDLASSILGGDAPRCRHLLLILDTCHSGAAALPLLEVAERIKGAIGGLARQVEFHVIAAARDVQAARTGWFADAFDAVVRSGLGSSEKEWLRPDGVVEEVNRRFDSQLPADAPDYERQRADLTGGGESYFRVFLNPRWLPRLRPGMNPEQRLRAVARIKETANRSHWSPRLHGVAVESDQGDYFAGRDVAVGEISNWAQDGGEARRGMAVTAGPGSGKSAVIARFGGFGEPSQTARSIGRAVQSHVYAKAKTHLEVALEVATDLAIDADNPDDLIDGLRAQTTSALIVVDALDEALNPSSVSDLLVSLLDASQNLRVLVGVRTGAAENLVAQLGKGFTQVDLDEDPYRDPEALVKHVQMRLARDPTSPYRNDLETAATVAAEVSRRAGNSFLIASHAARTLAQAAEPIDTGIPGWADRLPTTPEEAFDNDMQRFDVDESLARQVLAPLAFAQGDGLPTTLWDPLAAALAVGLSGRQIRAEQVEDWRNRLNYYLTGDPISGQRLYHEEFAKYLRRDRALAVSPDQPIEVGLQECQTRITKTLDSLVGAIDNPLRWLDAHNYVRTHLSTYAAEAHDIDSYLPQVGFLIAADPSRLHRAASAAASEEAFGVPLHTVRSPECSRRLTKQAIALLTSTSPRLRRERLGLQRSSVGWTCSAGGALV